MSQDVQCSLCPMACIVKPGQSGECRIRVNIDGRLTAVTYGFPCSIHVDPIEKKPMFHFLPGTRILSLATAGCTMHCKNCQNWEISQANPEDTPAQEVLPEQLPQLARDNQCVSVAYTYTDPAAYYEYALDGCIRVREAGLRNVLVTAAYINKAPMIKLCEHVDGATIDIKAMSDAFYRDVCGTRLAPVLDATVAAKDAGVMVEISNLVIPTLNDSDEDLRKFCRWVAEHMGQETPLHFLRFFPQYQMQNLPPTPADTLERARQIARAEGMRYVYIGNLDAPDAETTYCHVCKKKLIDRRRYVIVENNIVGGLCPQCKTPVHGRWK